MDELLKLLWLFLKVNLLMEHRPRGQLWSTVYGSPGYSECL